MANIDTASRISCASGCPRKFEYQYIQKIPQRDGGAFILGNTVHDGLQAWFEERAKKGEAKPGRLWELMQEAWRQHLPPPLLRHFKPELEVTLHLERAAAAIRLSRGLVKPEASKDYMALPEYTKRIELADKVRRWLDANENVIRWNKSEPPVKTWMVARRIAQRLEEDWLGRPVPFMVEQPFQVEHDGYGWRGRLDVYGPVTPDGELEPVLIDWKTGAQPPSPMELFFQGCIYHLAMAKMDLEVTEVQFHILRLPYNDNGDKSNPVRVQIDPEKHYPLLTSARRAKEYVINVQGIIEPVYSFACRNCDYNKFCTQELGIVKGRVPDDGDE